MITLHKHNSPKTNALFHMRSSMQDHMKSTKPHAVFVPFPSQGHINPLLKLAKLLHHRGFCITFVNTDFNHRRLLNLHNLPDFRFETIPDGLPPSDPGATQDIAALCVSTRTHSPAPFLQLLQKINSDSSSSNVPPVSCVVADGVMSFTLHATQRLNIPNVLFWTFGASGFMSLKLCADLTAKGVTPFKDWRFLTDGSLDAPVDWVAGLENFKLKHVAKFIQTTDANDIMLDVVKREIDATSKASALILYTFDEMERFILDALRPFFPPIYTIGPLQLLVDQIADKSSVGDMECSLWKAEEECMEWLDSKEENSVIYVNFGSIVVLTPTEIQELAMGLTGSKNNFLWVIRPDLLRGNSPPEITGDRGLIVRWCSQEKVLNHPSVGGFLTHCGWNSILEGITAGVPFLGFPRFAEQPANCRLVCNDLGIGLQLGGELKGDEVGRLANELLEGERGVEMRERAMEWKKKAIQATASTHPGSSFLNLQNLVKQVLLPMNSSG